MDLIERYIYAVGQKIWSKIEKTSKKSSGQYYMTILKKYRNLENRMKKR